MLFRSRSPVARGVELGAAGGGISGLRRSRSSPAFMWRGDCVTSARLGEEGNPAGLGRAGRLGVRLDSTIGAAISGVLGLEESASLPFTRLILLMTAGFSTLP